MATITNTDGEDTLITAARAEVNQAMGRGRFAGPIMWYSRTEAQADD